MHFWVYAEYDYCNPSVYFKFFLEIIWHLSLKNIFGKRSSELFLQLEESEVVFP